MLNALIIAITILTWNTGRMGEFKKPAQNEVLHYLCAQDADIICLQEVDRRSMSIRMRAISLCPK